MIDWPDMVNGALEFAGAWFTWRNAWQLWVDKEVKGVYWPMTLFFAGWGLWNLFYYSHLNQPWSWAGGLVLVAGNVAWVTLYWRFRRA